METQDLITILLLRNGTTDLQQILWHQLLQKPPVDTAFSSVANQAWFPWLLFSHGASSPVARYLLYRHLTKTASTKTPDGVVPSTRTSDQKSAQSNDVPTSTPPEEKKPQAHVTK